MNIKTIKKLLKESGYKYKMEVKEEVVIIDIQYKHYFKKFDMIKEFIPFLCDFSLYDDVIVLYLVLEGLE